MHLEAQARKSEMTFYCSCTFGIVTRSGS